MKTSVPMYDERGPSRLLLLGQQARFALRGVVGVVAVVFGVEGGVQRHEAAFAVHALAVARDFEQLDDLEVHRPRAVDHDMEVVRRLDTWMRSQRCSNRLMAGTQCRPATVRPRSAAGCCRRG
jgi:hypothetical protein